MGGGEGGAGGNTGTGKPPTGVLAGLTWLTCTVLQTMSSSYVTWYALGTFLTTKGPFHCGANLLVRSGGVVITKMRSSS